MDDDLSRETFSAMKMALLTLETIFALLPSQFLN